MWGKSNHKIQYCTIKKTNLTEAQETKLVMLKINTIYRQMDNYTHLVNSWTLTVSPAHIRGHHTELKLVDEMKLADSLIL